MLTCCRQIRVNLAGFWWLHLPGPFIMIGFLLVWLIQTAAGSVSPHWSRPATFIYSCNTIASFYMLCRQQGWGVEESTLCWNTENALARTTSDNLFLFVTKTAKWLSLLVVLLALKAVVAYLWLELPVWGRLSVKMGLVASVAGQSTTSGIACCPSMFFFFLLHCLIRSFYVELFSNKHHVWSCEQLLKFIWQCYSCLSSNQLGCIWPWRGLLCNTVLVRAVWGISRHADVDLKPELSVSWRWTLFNLFRSAWWLRHHLICESLHLAISGDALFLFLIW